MFSVGSRKYNKLYIFCVIKRTKHPIVTFVNNFFQVSSGVLAGILAIAPEKIQAVDMDSINSPIMYSFLSGSPSSFREFFEINPSTGAVRQVKPVDTSIAKIFEIIVKVRTCWEFTEEYF